MAIAQVELSESLASHRTARRFYLATLGFSALTFFLPTALAYGAAVIALAAQAAAWAYLRRASNQQSVGDQAGRRALLLDALGSTAERVDLGDVLQRLSQTAHDGSSKIADPNYFASQAPPGPARLRDHLQENAFWNKALYAEAAAARVKALVVPAALVGIVTLVALPLAPRDQSLTAARLVVGIVSLAAILTEVREIISWKAAETSVGQIDRRLETLAHLSADELVAKRLESVLAVFGDYCVITSSTPTIPRRIYQQNKDRLNRIWHERTASP